LVQDLCLSAIIAPYISLSIDGEPLPIQNNLRFVVACDFGHKRSGILSPLNTSKKKKSEKDFIPLAREARGITHRLWEMKSESTTIKGMYVNPVAIT